MKIISIVTAFPRNKNDVLIPWIIKLIHLLEKDNIKTDIFTSTYCARKSEEYEGIRVTRFRYFLKKFEKLSHDMAIPEKIKTNKCYLLLIPFFIVNGMINALIYSIKNDFDIIHVHFPFPLALFGIVMKWKTKKPLIYSCHGSETNLAHKNKIFRSLFRWMLKKADKIVVNSTFMEKRVKEIYSETSVSVIPMGSSIEPQNLTDKKKNNDSKTILFVGRLIKLKGVEYLIKAFTLLPDKSNLTLNIIGLGPELNNLKNLTQKLNIESNVHFLGIKKGKELEEIYINADIFVLPSIIDENGFTEGLGVVLIEAMQRNTAVIASNIGGIVDIVKDRKTGLLVPEKDAIALAGAIEELLDDKELYNKVVTGATNHIKSYFSWDRISKKYEEIYSTLKN